MRGSAKDGRSSLRRCARSKEGGCGHEARALRSSIRNWRACSVSARWRASSPTTFARGCWPAAGRSDRRPDRRPDRVDGRSSRAAPIADPRPSAASSSQGSGLRRLAVAAALAILAGAAGAVAALRSRAADAPPAAFPESSVSLPAPVREETDPDPEPATVTARRRPPLITRRRAGLTRRQGARRRPVCRGRAAPARAPCVRAPRLSGCVGAGRRTRAPLPRRSPRRRVRGVAGRVAPGRRACGRSQTRRCCFCGAVPAQRSPARYRSRRHAKTQFPEAGALEHRTRVPARLRLRGVHRDVGPVGRSSASRPVHREPRLRRRPRLSRRAGLRRRRQGAAGL